MTTYKLSGTCCKEVGLDINNGIIDKIDFVGGCPGNLLGLKILVEGSKTEDIISKLHGVPCGSKSTSCPDQLAKILKNLQ